MSKGPEREETGNRQFVTALARGLSILRCFDRPRIELTVAEIARLTKLSQPTAWRLCSTLLDCGFLINGTGTALRIGAPALTLGYAAARGSSPVELARPYLHQLTEKTRGNSMLSIRAGLDVLLVDHVEGAWIAPNQPVGWRAPLTAIPSGLAVLVGMDERQREETTGLLAQQDPAWPRHRQRIDEALAQFTSEGYVTLSGMVDGQYSAIAAPLFLEGQPAEKQWALSIGGPTNRWDEAHLRAAGQALKRVADLLRPALAVI